MIEELKRHLQSVGKTDESWLDLAKRFNILPNGTNKQRSDKVRRVASNINWNKNVLINTPLSQQPNNIFNQNSITSTGILPPYGSIGDCIIDNPFSSQRDWRDQLNETKSKEWDEFRKWKENKVGAKMSTHKSQDGMHIVLGCVHCPFESQQLIIKLCSFISDYKDKIAGFHLLGDFMDMSSLSPHNEKSINLNGFTLGQEYLAGNKVLDIFDSVLPKNIRKTYLGGNHEAWWDRYVANPKNYKTADTLPSPYEALKLKQRGYEVKTDWKEDFFVVGSYHLIHGLYCNINPCKAHIDKLRQNVLFAHTHRVGQHFEGKLHGMNIGTFADINSDGFKYSSRIERQAWNNGFAIVNIHGNHSQAELIVCTDNKFFYGGKQY